MKKAFIVVADGRGYQTFICDYILFAKTSYPDADIIILYTDSISKRVMQGINELKNVFGKETIILKHISVKDYFANKNAQKCQQVRRSLRWLLKLPEYDLYDQLYIGDIDLLICKEKYSLFDKHMEHSVFLKLPYSDIVRSPLLINKKATTFLKMIKWYGASSFKYYHLEPKQKTISKMTGLRFIVCKPYYDAVKPNQEIIIKKIDNLFESGTDDVFSIGSINNEQVLFELMKMSFKVMPNVGTASITCKETNSFNYRPHHGIHLSLFLDKKAIKKHQLTDVYNDVYSDYFNFFKKIEETKTFKKLKYTRNRKYRKILKNLNSFID